jgi:hypothetical protein
MSEEQPYTVAYDRATKMHLASIPRKYHALIRGRIEEQLSFTPTVVTRNRKPLDEPIVPTADWELRLGPDNRFRVFYRILVEERCVEVMGIAVKDRNRLYLGGQEVAS